MVELTNTDPNRPTTAFTPTLTFSVEYYQVLMKFEDLNKTLAPFHQMKLPPGSVLKPYRFSYRLFDPKSAPAPVPRIFLTAKEGFDELGLSCYFDDGVLTLEGYDETNGKPRRSYDGALRIFLDVKIPFKMPTRAFFSVPLSKTCKGALTCEINDKRVELLPKEFVIHPNPDTMWKTLPTDPSAPFPKADAESFGASLGQDAPITVLAASRRGRSHANEGKFRDDHVVVDLGANSDDWKILAIADGAGSAQYAREGSRIACEAVGSSLRKFFTEYNVHFDEAVQKVLDAKSDWQTNPTCAPAALQETNLAQFFCLSIRAAWEEIKKSAESRDAKIGDYNTTLLCAAFKRFAPTDARPALWAIASYWVGDGGFAIFRPNGRAKTLALGSPDGGEFAGQTRFVTMSDELAPERIVSRMRLNVVEEFQALALMTDGVSDPFFPSEINASEYKYWKTFWNETLPDCFPGVLDAAKSPEERAEALLAGLNFFVKGNHDDRTAALVLNDRCRLIDEPEEASAASSESAPDNLDSGSILVEGEQSSETEDNFSDSSLLQDSADSNLMPD